MWFRMAGDCGCIVRFEKGDVEDVVNTHRIWQGQLISLSPDAFGNGKGAQALSIWLLGGAHSANICRE